MYKKYQGRTHIFDKLRKVLQGYESTGIRSSKIPEKKDTATMNTEAGKLEWCRQTDGASHRLGVHTGTQAEVRSLSGGPWRAPQGGEATGGRRGALVTG